MGDSITYCAKCETNVACHLNRACLRKASPSPSGEATCSLLMWTPNPKNPREILGKSKLAPGITLYIIDLMEGRDDRGQMHGAFMSDELEREGLYDKALVNWLKWDAESQMREFLKIHAANVKGMARDLAAPDVESSPVVDG